MPKSVGETKLEEAILRIVVDSPFFRSLVTYLNFEVYPGECPITSSDGTHPVGGIQTGDRVILYENGIIRMTSDELTGIVMEQILHAALAHPARRRGLPDETAWRTAADLAAWQLEAEHALWLTMQGKSRPRVPDVKAIAGALREALGVPLFDPSVQTEEEMYRLLEGNMGGLGLGAIPQRDSHEWEDPDGEGTSSDDWSDRLQSAALQQEMAEEGSPKRGYDPLGFRRIVKRRLTPAVSWQSVLLPYLTRDRNEYDPLSWDRRFLHREEFWWPDLSDEETLRICIAVDNSGSVLDDTLARFFTEMFSVLSMYRTEATLLSFDAAVHTKTVASWREGFDPDELASFFKGGGGTDYEPVFEWLEKEGMKPDVLLILTDGLCTWEDRNPDFPVFWGICPCSGTYDEFLRIASVIPYGTPIFIPSP